MEARHYELASLVFSGASIEPLQERTDASFVLHKARVWERVNRHPVNERQRAVLNRLLDGFDGHLSTSKYAKLAKCSTDTALRDMRDLVSRGVLVKTKVGGEALAIGWPNRIRYGRSEWALGAR